ncbi:MAG: aminotransferase class I/II-fold pyridoxal phosphate-dependent enzyme, partial [Lachnospiraceae bacterium]
PLGPNVNALEKEVVEYVSTGYAAALSSGTAALHLSLRMLDVKEGDYVFVSDLTFSATCNPICYERATPVFIDSEEETWNMCPKALEKAFLEYPTPKAVILVHLYGTPAKLDEIMELCKKHNVPLIEDAAESMSSTYKGQQTGTFGEMGIFSFNGNKIITSSGGGMLLAKKEELAKKAVFLSTQARDEARYYQHSQIGFNYRMSNIVAGIARGQLLHLEEHKARKKEIYAEYKEAFKEIKDIMMNPMNKDGDANNWLSGMLLKKESDVSPYDIMDALEAQNIEARPVWKPMHLQPVFECYPFVTMKEDGISVGEEIFQRGLCLPSDIKNTKEDMELIIRIIKGFWVK